MDQPNRLDALLKLLLLEPNDLFLNYAVGIEYLADLRFDEAESCFKKVILLDQSYLAAYYELGKLSELRHSIVEALHFYKTGLEKAKLKKHQKAINEFSEAIFMLED